MSYKKYVLITPARNEESYIEKTIQSVISQTVLPEKWVIVSDGSTDRTDEIVKKYAEKYKFIYLLRREADTSRNFGSKVYAFNEGYEKMSAIEYDVIVNLDADITFEKDYFAFLLEKFEENQSLGVAGTPFMEEESHYDYRYTNIEHVSGACQAFRRECFDKIGGYRPIKGGGIDWSAVTTARMKGWQTRTFTEKECHHHRSIGTSKNSKLLSWFNHGKKDYFLGGHPLWQIFRTVYKMGEKPYVLGGFLLLFGYLWAMLSQIERPVSKELMAFHREEQMTRLKKFFLELKKHYLHQR